MFIIVFYFVVYKSLKVQIRMWQMLKNLEDGSNPLSPNIDKQIVLTGLYIFP